MMIKSLAGADAIANGPATPEWRLSDIVPYDQALAEMEARVAAIIDHQASEMVWLLQHPPLYTAGTSAKAADLLQPRFPVYQTGRGGQYTYHGPGQRIAYTMLDLRRRGQDVRRFVHDLEEWIIVALRHFDLTAERREGRVGLWVDMSRHGGSGEAKIAAIGVRVRRWVTFHGASLNVDPDLAHYDGIVPCGIAEHGVTSLAALGMNITLVEVDAALQAAWVRVFEK